MEVGAEVQKFKVIYKGNSTLLSGKIILRGTEVETKFVDVAQEGGNYCTQVIFHGNSFA